MSLKTAQENFNKAFIDSEKTLTEKFLKELKKYVERKTKTEKKTRYKEMLECMESGKPLASFLCRNDICEEVVNEMLKREIPFILVTNKKGEYGFVIRSSDRALANEAIKAVLRRLGSYCEIVTGDELVQIVQHMRDRDKGLIAINGLNLNELKLLEKLCRKEGFLEYIAEDELSDGTFRFMVHGKQASAEHNFALILFKMIMMTEGANKMINNKRIANELKVQKLRANEFGRKNGIQSPIYIVGSGNQFMKIEQNGFVFGYAIKEADQIRIIEQFSATTSTPAYREYERSFLNRIPDPTATTSINQVMEHLARTENERDSLDFGMTRRERENYFGEAILVSSIMHIVSKHVVNDDIMNVSGRWLEKTGHVSYEAGKLLNGLIRNEVPIGYDQLDIMELRTSISEYDLDLNAYTTVSDNLRGIDITNERGTLEIKGSVQDRIAEMHEQVIDTSPEIEISESVGRS